MNLLLALALLPLSPAVQEKKDEPKSAKDLLQAALTQAQEGKKRVLLTFGGPG